MAAYWTNNVTNQVSYTLPTFMPTMWTYHAGTTTSTGLNSGTTTEKKSNWLDTAGGVVSLLTGAYNSIFNKDDKDTQTINSAGSGSAVSNQVGTVSNAGTVVSSFNWTTLLLPFVGVVIIVILIIKK